MNKVEASLRWLIRSDWPAVLEINRHGPLPMDATSLDFFLKGSHSIGMVAEDEAGWVVGFALYVIHAHSIELVHCGVLPSHRRRGIGAAMVTRLREKAASGRRGCVRCVVPDDLLDAHLFLRGAGFRATDVLGPDRDFYQFEAAPIGVPLQHAGA